MIDRRTLTMWLATLDENRVAEAARPVVVAFQAEAADALDAATPPETRPRSLYLQVTIAPQLRGGFGI